MNSNNRHINSNNSNSQQWMMPPEHGPEPFNYMVSRPPGSVLPMPSLQLQHPSNQLMQQSQHEEELSVSPPAQALDYDHPRFHKGGNRAVIPSKRAAQNRAAQKAFRQRREQYIKDLEIKAKEMEDWQNELDRLRKENGELRDRVSTLENQVSVLTGGDPSKPAEIISNPSPTMNITKESVTESVVDRSLERSMSLPIASIINENDDIVRRGSDSTASTTLTAKRPNSESRLRHERHETENSLQQEDSFAPVPLTAPNQAGFESASYHPRDQMASSMENATTTDNNNKRRKHEDLVNPSQNIGQAPNPAVATPSINAIFNNPIPQTSPSNSGQNTLLLPIQNQQQPHQHHQQQQQQQQQQHQHPNAPNDHWGNNNNMQVGDFDLDFDFDPFFEDEFGPTLTSNNDFLPNANSGQVLDDLFAMLQTRQRPQIPIVPSDDNSDFPSNNNSNNLLK